MEKAEWTAATALQAMQGAFGGIIPELNKKGVPAVITTDGPAGIRIRKYTSLLPCGTALASTFNTRLVEELCSEMGKELKNAGQMCFWHRE